MKTKRMIAGLAVTCGFASASRYGPSYLTIGDGYTGWSVGATATFKQLVAGLAYVDTNKSFPTASGRNASSAGIVASLGVTF